MHARRVQHPVGGDETGGVSAAVAQAVKVVRDSGLPYETNAMFTDVEGEWDEVMTVVKRAVEVVVAASPRASLVLKADIRPGHTGQLTAKVRRVEELLATGYQPKGSQIGRRQQHVTPSDPSVRRRSSERS